MSRKVKQAMADLLLDEWITFFPPLEKATMTDTPHTDFAKAMTEQKYDHRLVGRNSLTDLEAAVRELAEDGWQVENPDHGPTIGQALADVVNSVQRGVGLTLPIGVGMCKPVSEAELQRRQLEKAAEALAAEQIGKLEEEVRQLKTELAKTKLENPPA